MKWLFPSLWIVLVGLVAIAMWAGAFHAANGALPPDAINFMVIVWWPIMSGIILWICAPLKRVAVDDETLYASNYLWEESIPLREISHVAENQLFNPHTVIIHLDRPASHDERIVFIPKVRCFPIGQHPIVGELQELCDRAKSRVNSGANV